MASLRELFLTESDRSLKTLQKVNILSAFFGAVLTSVTILITKGIDYAGISASLFSIGFVFAADRISKFELENKLEREFSKITMNIANFEYIGDAEAGARWFIKYSKEMELVKNTVFNRTDRKEQPGVASIRTDIMKSMKEAINNNCSWTDVYIQKEEKTVLKLHEELDENGKEIHTMIKLDSKHPMIQLLLIKYHGSTENTAVLFGWGVSGSNNSRVYLTKDRAAFDYFTEYFDMLSRSGTLMELDQNNPPNLIPLRTPSTPNP